MQGVRSLTTACCPSKATTAGRLIRQAAVRKPFTMNNIPEIRQALEADAPAISELIEASIQPAQILKLLGSSQMVWLVAAAHKSLTGVLAISERSHVKYFFVHPTFQKLGIGKQLWEFALGGGLLANTVTVRSSLFAVPVYERLGFKTVGSAEVLNGMHYQTMVARGG